MNKNPLMVERVTAYQNKRGIQYATADGALYKFLKILYILSFAANTVFNLFYILVKLVSVYAGNSANSDMSGLVIISVATALLTVGLALTLISRTRRVGRIVSAVALVTAAVALASITLSSASAADIETKSFLGLPLYYCLRHALPALAGFLLLLWMELIEILSSVKYNRLYRRLETESYAQYTAQTEAPTDEGWNAFLSKAHHSEL